MILELFFGIDFSHEYKKQLFVVSEELRSLLDTTHSHFEKKEKLHLTLSYVRNVETYSNAVTLFKDFSFPSFTLHPQGIGCFINAGETVFWVGTPAEKETVSQLKMQLDEILIQHNFDVERREYTPHITLAYSRKKDAPPQALWSAIKTDLPPFPVDAIHLFRAPLSRDSETYEKLATFKLTTPEGQDGQQDKN